MCSLWKPICGVIIILQDFLNPNGIPGAIPSTDKSFLLLKKMYFLVARSFLFLVIYPISVLYVFPVQFSTNCNGVSFDQTPTFLHVLLSVQTKQRE